MIVEERDGEGEEAVVIVHLVVKANRRIDPVVIRKP
jgi:hypothetical protein